MSDLTMHPIVEVQYAAGGRQGSMIHVITYELPVSRREVESYLWRHRYFGYPPTAYSGGLEPLDQQESAEWRYVHSRTSD